MNQDKKVIARQLLHNLFSGEVWSGTEYRPLYGKFIHSVNDNRQIIINREKSENIQKFVSSKMNSFYTS